jgi:hypothetical protein
LDTATRDGEVGLPPVGVTAASDRSRPELAGPAGDITIWSGRWTAGIRHMPPE